MVRLCCRRYTGTILSIVAPYSTSMFHPKQCTMYILADFARSAAKAIPAILPQLFETFALQRQRDLFLADSAGWIELRFYDMLIHDDS